MSDFSIPNNLLGQDPYLQTPHGPTWLVDGAEANLGEGSFLVRRLTSAHSMLRVGAVLGHAARIELPNLRPVSHWTKTKEGVWIATQMDSILSPLVARRECEDWVSAVESWRPLVTAIQRAHRSGIVHGSLSPWTLWTHPVTKRWIASEGGTWIGDGPGSGIWCPWQDKAQPEIQDDVTNLARLLVFATRGAEEASQLIPNLHGLPGYAIPVIERALRGELISTSELLSALAPSGITRQTDAETGETTTLLYGRVHGAEEVTHPRMGKGIKFWITRQDPSNPEALGAFFYESHGEVYLSMKDVWDGAEINMLDGRVVRDSTGQRFITAQATTLPVIEPHWPVSVTNALKAHGCASRFFVDLRESGSSGKALVLGNLVHGFLEDLKGLNVDISFQQAWEHRISKLRLSLLAAGLQEKQMKALKAEAESHFDAIFALTQNPMSSNTKPGWTGRNVEVTRYSSLFGIEGRIDLVTEDPATGLHIIELKTGRPYDSHLSQMRAYRLLWDGLANQRAFPVSGYLLYSKEATLREAPFEDPIRDRALLHARNTLVACHHAAAFNPALDLAPHYMQVPQECQSNDCRFRRAECAEQTSVLGLDKASPKLHQWPGFDEALIKKLRQHWAHFNRLLEIENWRENEEFGWMLRSDRLGTRIETHRAVASIVLEGLDPELGTVVVRTPQARVFSRGDTLVLHRADFHSDHMLRGRVVDIVGTAIYLDTAGAPIADTLPKEGWILDKLPVRLGYRAAQRALYRFASIKNARFAQVLLDPSSSRAESLMTGERAIDLLPSTTSLLNPNQLEAVVAAVSSPIGAIVQGPPGTGKTTVIAHVVRELVNRGQRVLLCAQTHTAVDSMMSKVIEVLEPSTPILRVGAAHRSPGLRKELEQRGLVADKIFSVDLARATTNLDVLRDTLGKAMVVGCTTHAAARSDEMDILTLNQVRLFDSVIVDEASQITEPMTLAPIVRGKRFVLVGDHKQLPPIVRSEQGQSLIESGWQFDTPDADIQGGLFAGHEPAHDTMGLSGLNQSLFERLANNGVPYVMLTEQYRMHKDIMAFSNRQFYDGFLRAAPVTNHRLLELDTLPGVFANILNPKHPVVFVGVDSDAPNGRTNDAEAQVVQQLVDTLRDNAPNSRIGVISPFRAQVRLISSLLGNKHQGVDVDTVERYQGSERDVIIVSLVKTERAGEFLSDPRRLNVTLTRARTKLIIIGKTSCLEFDPMFRDLIHQESTLVVPWEST